MCILKVHSVKQVDDGQRAVAGHLPLQNCRISVPCYEFQIFIYIFKFLFLLILDQILYTAIPQWFFTVSKKNVIKMGDIKHQKFCCAGLLPKYHKCQVTTLSKVTLFNNYHCNYKWMGYSRWQLYSKYCSETYECKIYTTIT